MSYLLTEEEITALTGITQSDIPNDIIDLAENQVKKKLGKDYATVSETETFYLYTEQSYIQLKHQNIVAVSSFTIADVNETGLKEDDDEFKLFKEEGIIYCSQLTTFKSTVITYTYGACAVEDIDKYLHLLFLLKMIILSNPDIVPAGKMNEKIGDYSIRYNVADLKQRPQMIDEEINRVTLSGEDTLHFI